jgi:proteasome lid subunit RPN8/RPN11
MSKLSISVALVDNTIDHLREGGRRRCETVVFWLGKGDTVDEVYRPEQEVSIDYFRLSGESMRSLMTYLRQDRRRILAQVHSHPNEAFHSKADDNWAVIRHEGALSLVLPQFASTTILDNFFDQTATFSLSPDDKWLEVATADVISISG